ncbi:MAG: P-II family nitrogen regulator [bacterium]
MKYIIAVIRPDRLEEVKRMLENSEIGMMTVSEVVGCGRQRGGTRPCGGGEGGDGLKRKIKLEIAVGDVLVEPAIEAITRGARTGNIGDGKIFVFDLEESVRIRTGERGGRAVAS